MGGGASGSDKKVGVVGLTLFDLRRRGKVGKLSMVGTNGTKFPAISELDPSFQRFSGLRLTHIKGNISTRTLPRSTTA